MGNPNKPKSPIPAWLGAHVSAPGGQGSYAPDPGTQVQFPRHLYPIEGAETIDFRRVALLNPGETVDLIDFTPQRFGVTGTTLITHYAIFNDGLLEEDFRFIPTLNGYRIYRFHGNPQFNPPLISLGLAPDLADEALIDGFLTMKPQDRLKWTATNDSAVQVSMGVRVVGYVDQSSRVMQTRVGG